MAEEQEESVDNIVDEIVAEEADVDENITEARVTPEREQRKFARYRVKMSISIRLSDGDIARAQAVDISLGGVYIEYAASADEGRVFEMFFDLPFRDEFKRVFVKAEVVRCIVIGNRHLYGIAFNFTEYARQAEEILEAYVAMREQRPHM